MYDERLAERIRNHLGPRLPFDEKKMFGGVVFMVGGHMACGIIGSDLLVRTGPTRYQEALARPHVRPMDFTGRPMTGLVIVAEAALDEAGLEEWLAAGTTCAQSLPPKVAGTARRPRPIAPATRRRRTW